MAYRFAGKQKTLALGVYPAVTLKDARNGALDAKAKLNTNIDSSLAKQQERRQSSLEAANTFEVIARDWRQHHLGNWTANHAKRVISRLEGNVFPIIGPTPITELKPPHIKSIIRKIENREALDVAKRVLQDVRRVFSYAVELGHVEDKRQSLFPYSLIKLYLLIRPKMLPM